MRNADKVTHQEDGMLRRKERWRKRGAMKQMETDLPDGGGRDSLFTGQRFCPRHGIRMPHRRDPPADGQSPN